MLGTVAALWRYPVKSLLGEQLTRARLTAGGIEGDRGLAIVDRGTGEVLSGRRVPGLLEGRALLERDGVKISLPGGEVVAAVEADDAVSAWLGRDIRIAEPDAARPVIADEDGESFRGMAGTFFDSSPVHVVTTATMAHLEALYPEGMFDPRRFRPNIVVDAGDEGPVEQAWVGRTIRVGKVLLAIRKPCRRCVMTTLEQDDLPHDRGILRTVAREADNTVGVYALVEQRGEIAVEDVVEST
ncbi:MAG TPA: MOSC domain-containing protein [Actinomycetota bacterium]